MKCLEPFLAVGLPSSLALVCWINVHGQKKLSSLQELPWAEQQEISLLNFLSDSVASPCSNESCSRTKVLWGLPRPGRHQHTPVTLPES